MKNWRTTSASLVTALALYVTQVDPTCLQLIPEPYRTYVYKFIGFLVFAGIITTGALAKDSHQEPPPPSPAATPPTTAPADKL